MRGEIPAVLTDEVKQIMKKDDEVNTQSESAQIKY